MPLEPAPGGTKKFLYTSSASSKNTESDQWSFSAAKPTNQQSPRGISVDLNSAWSIRNVGLTARSTTSAGLSKSDPNKNVPSRFYSRHGGLNGHIGVTNNVDAFGKSAGGQWVSSGHNFSQVSQMTSSAGTPPQSSGSTRRKQNCSPLDNDANDF